MAIALAACAGPQHPRPSPTTVAAIERAETAELKRDHEVARRLYLDAIAGAPDPISERFARHELADTLLSWGEIADGAAQLEAIVAIAPDDASAWHDLGVVRHGLGDDPGAIAALTRARDLAPHDQRPRIALAALYWRLGDRPHALAEYDGLRHMDLPDRLARKVVWAIECLQRPEAHPDCPRP